MGGVKFSPGLAFNQDNIRNKTRLHSNFIFLLYSPYRHSRIKPARFMSLCSKVSLSTSSKKIRLSCHSHNVLWEIRIAFWISSCVYKPAVNILTAFLLATAHLKTSDFIRVSLIPLMQGSEVRRALVRLSVNQLYLSLPLGVSHI